MKAALIIFLALDIFLVLGAGIRVATSSANTDPYVDFSAVTTGGSSSSTTASSGEAGVGETGASGAFVDHMKGSQRVDEIGETGSVSTSSPHGNAGASATGSLERASAVEDNRESDLDDAKKKMGQIGK